MKIFNIFFCLAFVSFAALQYNDPDPYLWMPIYLYPAALCWLAAKNKMFPKAYILGTLVFAAYAIYKIFDANGLVDWITLHNAENIAETMKAETPWVEETREFFGLAIIIVVLTINLFFSRKKSKA